MTPADPRPVLVLGGGGQLGSAIVREFQPAARVVAPAHRDLDITDFGQVLSLVAAEQPSAIVNCAAYNNVDGAEDDPVTALAVNAIAIRTLARAAADAGAAFVHYSSDFVFDGTATRPYTEEDRPNPQSAYAASKLLGEWFAADVPRHYVLRVESLFGAELAGGPARGSVASILQTILSGGEARVFADRTVTATFVVDAARATRQLLASDAPVGIYHCVNTGACTWAEFAEELARRLGVAPRLARVRMGDVQLRARRPQYCALSNAKLRTAGVDMPTWQDAIGRYLQHLGHEVAG